MYFKFGSYKHADNEVDLTQFSVQRLYSPRNRLAFKRATVVLQGHLLAVGQADNKEAIQALQSAYRYDLVNPGDGDAGLYHDDGTKSAHFLDQASSINGIRVQNLLFDKEDGGEYATGRRYSVVLQADYMVDWEDTIYTFQERVIHIGDTSHDWEYVPQFIAPPVQQMNHVHTVEKIIQTGEAVGIQGYPLLPPTLLPDAQRHGNLDRVEYGSCRYVGRNQLMLYPVSWQYVYSMPVPTTVVPHLDYPGH